MTKASTSSSGRRGRLEELRWTLVSLLVVITAGCGGGCSPRAGSLPRVPVERPNFMVIVVDMLRSDHLGIYGYEKQTSPNIDRLGEKGLVFDNAYSPASWTYPSVVSMLTGLYPSSHGATRLWEAGKGEEKRVLSVVSEPSTWLPRRFAALGYRTAAFYSQAYVAPAVEPAFDDARDLALEPGGGRYMDSIFWTAHDWLQSHADEPFLLYLHSSDVHGPYPHLRLLDEDRDAVLTDTTGGFGLMPRPELDLRWRSDRRMYWPSSRSTDKAYLYDGHLRFVDTFVGRLYDELVELGIADNTYLIVTSDHGEAFGEHGDWEHGGSVFEELIRVPLIVASHLDAQSGLRIPELVNTAGLLPTLLELVEVNVDASVDAPSFAGLLEQRDTASWRYLSVSESSYYSAELQALMIDPAWKLVTDRRTNQVQLFDLRSDPDELKPLGAGDLDDPAAAKLRELIRMRDGFDAIASRRRLATQRELDDEDLSALRALGYVD